MSDKKPIFGGICSQLRQERRENISYKRLDSKHAVSLEEILTHVNGTCECQGDNDYIDSREDEPWKEEYVIRKLYEDNRNQFTEMADILDCHSETAKKYVDKFDISTIDSSNRTSSPRVNRLQEKGKSGDVEIKKEGEN